jgi:hypothetical protein
VTLPRDPFRQTGRTTRALAALGAIDAPVFYVVLAPIPHEPPPNVRIVTVSQFESHTLGVGPKYWCVDHFAAENWAPADYFLFGMQRLFP